MTQQAVFDILRRQPFADVYAAYKKIGTPDILLLKNNPGDPLIKKWRQDLDRVIEEHGWNKKDFEEMSRIETLRKYGAPEDFIFRKRK